MVKTDEEKKLAKEKKKAKKEKGVKKEKRKRAPAPLNPFIRFSLEERPKIKAVNPTWLVGDIMKEVAARYSKLTQAEKDHWKEVARVEFAAKQKAQAAALDDAVDDGHIHHQHTIPSGPPAVVRAAVPIASSAALPTTAALPLLAHPSHHSAAVLPFADDDDDDDDDDDNDDDAAVDDEDDDDEDDGGEADGGDDDDDE